MWRLICFCLMAMAALAQEGGNRVFAARCGFCHGADGAGGERGPRVASDRGDLGRLLREGAGAMPAVPLSEAEFRAVSRAVRRMVDRVEGPSASAASFRPSAGPSRDWPTYNGELSGNRYSPLREIHTGNVARLAPRWIFSVPSAGRHETTPLVIGGAMYITAANEAYALDPRDGRQIWRFARPRTKGLIGDTASGINRGAAVDGDRLFFVTDNAHLLALNRFSGKLLWEVEMADSRQHYGSTSAPLVVGGLVVAGQSGGDEGARGFLDAYHVSTGERAWRFWTVPARGEPLADTWRGSALEHGCAATWLTGTFDPETRLLYWTTGNPCPDYNGDERQGDNLYSDSVVALDIASGKLKWYFQFTPHDLHDWDATQTPLLVDRAFRGRPRKLLLQANRNGFFYVLDRLTGEFLQATPFAKKLTWAKGVDAKGRPIVNPAAVPTPEGVKACPSVEGATNWYSVAWLPSTGWFYAQTLEKCTIYTKAPGDWKPGESYYNGDTRNVPEEPGQKVLRAIDPETGRVMWEQPQQGPATSWGGVLATDGGLIFFGDDSGDFSAADAKTGKVLWRFPANSSWKASPMTYRIDGKQYVAVQSGSSILAFGL